MQTVNRFAGKMNIPLLVAALYFGGVCAVITTFARLEPIAMVIGQISDALGA